MAAAAAAAAAATPPSLPAISGAVVVDPRRRRPFLLPLPYFRTTPSRHLSHSISSSLFRRKSRKPPPTSEPRLKIVIDPEEVSRRASASLRRFCDSYRLRFDRFVAAGDKAWSDLRSLVTVDRQGRVVIACRRSTLEFLAGFAVWGFVVVVGVRVLAGLLSGWRLGIGTVGWDWVRRRDRSLGGKEMVVGKRLKWGRSGKGDVNPLSSVGGGSVSSKSVVKRSALTERSRKLPDWWRSPAQSLSRGMGDEDARREVKRLARAIMDDRMSGKDVTEDDIIQLRRGCKASGAKVYFEAENTRDALFRASVDFVMNTCSKTSNAKSFNIDGEEVHEFISGLAENFGLEDIRAAIIVGAAVAARTRSGFLGAWAFEIQGKRLDALQEFLKICRIHQAFPPQVNSPEMEMVAHGLKSTLKLEQREHLYRLFKSVCQAENHVAIQEALGLSSFSETP